MLTIKQFIERKKELFTEASSIVVRSEDYESYEEFFNLSDFHNNSPVYNYFINKLHIELDFDYDFELYEGNCYSIVIVLEEE